MKTVKMIIVMLIGMMMFQSCESKGQDLTIKRIKIELENDKLISQSSYNAKADSLIKLYDVDVYRSGSILSGGILYVTNTKQAKLDGCLYIRGNTIILNKSFGDIIEYELIKSYLNTHTLTVQEKVEIVSELESICFDYLNDYERKINDEIDRRKKIKELDKYN